MRIFNKISISVFAASVALALSGSIIALAATTPSVGTAATYAILGSTYTNTSAGTTINGDVGFTTPPAVTPLGTHTNYGSGAPYAAAGTDQGSALSALASQVCTFTFANGPIDLATDTTHGPIGVYTPGVYCTGASSAASIGTAGITLNGAGTYIFRVNGALTSVSNSVVTLAGASACDVFWTPTAATTLGANSTFVGTNIDASGITIGSATTWIGRALAFGGTVTTNTDTITAPTCGGTPPPPAPTPTCTLSANPTAVQTGSSSSLSWTTTNATSFSINQSIGSVTPVASGSHSVAPLVTTTYVGTASLTGGSTAICSATVTVTTPPALATLHVIKQVVNNGGGTAIASDFTIHVENSGANVSGSPAPGAAAPGTSYSLSAGTYVVSENANTSYAMQSSSGDCNSSGSVTLSAGDNKTCTIVNTYIVPVPVPAPTPVPKAPNTGYAPNSQNIPWQFSSGILATVALAAVLIKRKQIFSSR